MQAHSDVLITGSTSELLEALRGNIDLSTGAVDIFHSRVLPPQRLDWGVSPAKVREILL